MKKISIILSCALLVLLGSCGSKSEGGMSAAAKKNKEANDAIVKMFESGDWSKMGDYIDKDVVDHAGMNGDVRGIDSLRAQFKMMTEMMSNMKNDVKRTLADDDYVMCWLEGTATAKVDLPDWGMKAGETHTSNSVEVSKFKDGKVVEHWSFMDPNEMMKMMSKMSPGAMPMPADTTKM